MEQDDRGIFMTEAQIEGQGEAAAEKSDTASIRPAQAHTGSRISERGHTFASQTEFIKSQQQQEQDELMQSTAVCSGGFASSSKKRHQPSNDIQPKKLF